MVQTKAEKAAKKAAWYQKNKADILVKQKIYNEQNKDKRAAWAATRYQNNRVDVLAKTKDYYLKNKEQILARHNEYNSRPEVKERMAAYAKTKDVKVKGWIRLGLLDDYDMVWDRYSNTEFCELCQVRLTEDQYCTSTRKSMDHCHETGKFRNVVCHRCNMTRKTMYSNNTSGHTGIHQIIVKGDIRWQHQYTTNDGRLVTRRFASKIDCICFKYITKLRTAANQINRN